KWKDAASEFRYRKTIQASSSAYPDIALTVLEHRLRRAGKTHGDRKAILPRALIRACAPAVVQQVCILPQPQRASAVDQHIRRPFGMASASRKPVERARISEADRFAFRTRATLETA